MWNLKKELNLNKEEQAAVFRRKANELLAGIDGVLRLEVWQGYKAGNHDLALYVEFTDPKAEEDYQTHPDHLLMKEYVASVTCDRAIIDAEV